MPKPDRLKFAECLDKMFHIFAGFTIPGMHQAEVTEYIETMHKAKDLLAKIAGKEEDNNVYIHQK